METKLKPYSEYKKTGLPWLTAVPAHWGLVRTKHLFSERVQKGHPDEPLLAATQTKGVVRKEKYGSRTVTAMKDLHLLKLVEPGDYVISLRSFEGGIELAHDRGIISPAYTVLEPGPRALEGYFAHFFKSNTFIDSLSLYVTGIREGQNIDYRRLSRNELPIPPPDEQEAIGRFLRAKVGQANRLIRTKQRLIALLNEQKQAIIQRAVTRGLDPDVPLKPSGVDWLGEVPEHWEIRKLRHLFRIHGSGTTPAGDSYYGGGIPWVMTGDLTNGEVTTTKRAVTDKALNEVSALKLYPPGSLAVAMYGATIGKSGIFAMSACTNQACCVLAEPLNSVRVRFVQAVVATANNYLVEQGYGGGQPNINAEIVRSLRIPLPSQEEQDLIVEFLEDEVAAVDEVIKRAADEIDLIREYRTRLIADVVTGKLDVRGVEVPEVENDGMDADLDVAEDDESILGDQEIQPEAA